jgi:hypothetical protein
LAASFISKMRSSLSMRRTIRRWWRLARTEAAPSLAFTRLRNALVRDSNLYWPEEGYMPWCQASVFAISTLPM